MKSYYVGEKKILFFALELLYKIIIEMWIFYFNINCGKNLIQSIF